MILILVFTLESSREPLNPPSPIPMLGTAQRVSDLIGLQ